MFGQRTHSQGPLFEKYRPQTWSEVVGQDKAIAALARLRDAGGFGGRAIWLDGASGTGKSTIARLAALEIADESCIEVIDGSEVTAARVKEIEERFSLYGWGKGGRAIIIEEAHGIPAHGVRALLLALERIPGHCLVAFTTCAEHMEGLFEGVDSAPLLSRCVRVSLSRRGLAEPFAERVRIIAQAEGLDGLPPERYLRLAKDDRNNFRSMLTAVESGAMLAE